MCVLIVKPSGVKMPSEEILKLANRANPHGCGFATKDRYYKTLNFSQFKYELSNISDDEDCIIHFRYATHGSIKQANCHPFKKNDVIFAHNGILSINPIGDKTDSETAFLQIIYPAIKQHGFGSTEADDAVYSVIGSSRFALMQGDDIRMYGDFTKFRGVYYSNLRFLPFNKQLLDIS